MTEEFNLKKAREELLNFMLMETPEDKIPFAIMFKKLVKDLLTTIKYQDKEFIRLLKEEIEYDTTPNDFIEIIDKLAGDKLEEIKK